MIAALGQLLLAAMTLAGQDLPGLWAGAPDRFSGETPVNFRLADMDRDGIADLLLPGLVCFQWEGSFPEKMRASFPNFGERCAVDVWNARLFCWDASMLRAVEWDGAAWKVTLEQELARPEGLALPDAPGPGAGVWGDFARYLYDLDGDGQPELVAVTPESLQAFTLRDGRYAPLPGWEILPPMRLAPPGRLDGMDREFSLAARNFVLPVRRMTCRAAIENQQILVLVQEAAPTGDDGQSRAVYTETRFSLDGENRIAGSKSWTSPALAATMQPCRLNRDELLDFAGEGWSVSQAASVPTPVHETFVSLDGGLTFVTRKTYSYRGVRPHCLFLDWDGDGDRDLYSEYPDWHVSGAREMASRFLTRAGVKHSVCVYAQAEGGFSDKPVYKSVFDIDFVAPPVKATPDFLQYCAGNWVNASGDFNGDGSRDLAVRVSAKQLDVFLTRGGGTENSPAASLTLPAEAYTAVSDVDGDGRADLIVSWLEHIEGTARNRTSVYFSRETSP